MRSNLQVRRLGHGITLTLSSRRRRLDSPGEAGEVDSGTSGENVVDDIFCKAMSTRVSLEVLLSRLPCLRRQADGAWMADGIRCYNVSTIVTARSCLRGDVSQNEMEMERIDEKTRMRQHGIWACRKGEERWWQVRLTGG